MKTVFLSTDEDSDPETVYHFSNLYNKDMMSGFIPNSDALTKIKEIFQNIGCIYLLEKDSGNVIGIFDPTKHPL